MLISFLFYDFYSGVLHITLDNPEFLSFPILDKPCLEFQWHHQIPTDLATKNFTQTCGDLNGTIAVIGSIFLAVRVFFNFHSPIIDMLIGWKVLMAYFGQYSHTMCHTPLNMRPELVKFLQNFGLMISSHEHHKHHRNHDTNFCIGSGMMNPLVTFLHDLLPNKWVWLTTLILISVIDVPLCNMMLLRVF